MIFIMAWPINGHKLRQNSMKMSTRKSPCLTCGDVFLSNNHDRTMRMLNYAICHAPSQESIQSSLPLVPIPIRSISLLVAQSIIDYTMDFASMKISFGSAIFSFLAILLTFLNQDCAFSCRSLKY